MNIVKIGTNEKPLNEATDGWIAQHVEQRREHRQPVCVQVILKDSSVDMILTTPACGGSGGGGRLPNRKERQIFNLWDEKHLNQNDWSVGNLIAFLKQLQRLI